MDVNVFVTLIGLASLFFGGFLGFLFSKIRNKIIDKKLLKDAMEVLEGKKKNVIIIDGQEYDATKFVTRDDAGNETIIDLEQGGTQKKYEKEISKEEKLREDNHPRTLGKDSPSPREKKRNSGTIPGRLRRFG